jgi:hypothetical protein
MGESTPLEAAESLNLTSPTDLIEEARSLLKPPASSNQSATSSLTQPFSPRSTSSSGSGGGGEGDDGNRSGTRKRPGRFRDFELFDAEYEDEESLGMAGAEDEEFAHRSEEEGGEDEVGVEGSFWD